MIIYENKEYYEFAELKQLFNIPSINTIKKYCEYLDIELHVIIGKSKQHTKGIISQDFDKFESFMNKNVNERKKLVSSKTMFKKYGYNVTNASQLKFVKDKKKSTSKNRIENQNYVSVYSISNEYNLHRQLIKALEIDGYIDILNGKRIIYKNKLDEFKKHIKYLKSLDYNEYLDYVRSKLYGEDWREKISLKSQETKLKKYGKKSTTNVEKSIKSKLEKYGTLVINHRYLFNDIYFDSSWEIYFYIYHHDILKNNIKRGPVFEYYLDGTKHLYECDFEIDGKYYEIKGPQYLKDGQLYFPYSENKEYQQEVWNAKNECMKSNNVQIVSDIEQIKKSVDEMYTEDFVDLFRIDVLFPYPTEIRTQLDICRVFHKSLYEATRLNKPSPYDAWFDKNLVYKCAMNRLKYVHSCTPNDIIKGFQISMIAPKVSIFKPTLAERLIKTYLNDYKNIYDPFSGFSGRLIGANNCKKNYHGFDINVNHVKESNEIIDYLNCKESCNVKVQDLLNDSIHTLDSDSCLFTCPPYGGKEHWNKNNDEVEKSCDEWIDVCMDKYRCDKYLFVVDKTEKYKDYIVETISNKSHFGENKEYVVLINK